MQLKELFELRSPTLFNLYAYFLTLLDRGFKGIMRPLPNHLQRIADIQKMKPFLTQNFKFWESSSRLVA